MALLTCPKCDGNVLTAGDTGIGECPICKHHGPFRRSGYAHVPRYACSKLEFGGSGSVAEGVGELLHKGARNCDEVR
jgi:hypothetical protein